MNFFGKHMQFTLLSWDINISLTARWGWHHFRIHRTEFSRHLVWGKLSVLVENWELELHPLCAQCDSADIAERGGGDEYLTVCGACQTVEGGYRYVNLREYDKAS